MEDSSDEDEEDYADFNRVDNNDSELNQMPMVGFYEKKHSVLSDRKSNKIKLGKKSNKNRLIRSMQNLLSFDRSRSNSAENSASPNDESEMKAKRKSKL